MPTCASELEHRWKVKPDGYSYVCVLCDEQRYELHSKSSQPRPMQPYVEAQPPGHVGCEHDLRYDPEMDLFGCLRCRCAFQPSEVQRVYGMKAMLQIPVGRREG